MSFRGVVVDSAAGGASAAAAESSDATVERASLEYVPKYQRYVVRQKKFSQQFSHIYTKRLQQMRPAVIAAAAKAWGVDQACLDGRVIAAVSGADVMLVGTLYKEMKLKPNILDEFSKERQIAPPPTRANYCSEDDTMVLEDESGRVTLVGCSALVAHFVTGVVCAVKGRVGGGGELHVEDLVVHGIASPPPLPVPTAPSGPFCLLVGDLGLGHAEFNPLPLTLLSEFVLGLLGGAGDARGSAAVARVVFCGGVIHLAESAVGDEPIDAAAQDRLVEPLSNADLILSQIASGAPVDVMPGKHDPSNFTLPQQPLHRCLFPKASRFSTFRPVTNPYDAQFEGARFLGSAGQPTEDIIRYTSSHTPYTDYKTGLDGATASAATPEADGEPGGAGDASSKSAEVDPAFPPGSVALDVLETTLRWGHLAPTAPDTLGCYPFYEQDPFVISDAPHVYFTSNSRDFATREVKGHAEDGLSVRLIAVPSFAATSTAVLVDLATLACTPLKFGADVRSAKH